MFSFPYTRLGLENHLTKLKVPNVNEALESFYDEWGTEVPNLRIIEHILSNYPSMRKARDINAPKEHMREWLTQDGFLPKDKIDGAVELNYHKLISLCYIMYDDEQSKHQMLGQVKQEPELYKRVEEIQLYKGVLNIHFEERDE